MFINFHKIIIEKSSKTLYKYLYIYSRIKKVNFYMIIITFVW